MELKRTLKTCEVCAKEFLVRNCYLKRSHRANHLKKFKTKQSGVTLWRHILRISDEELREQFDIRCELCNWQFHLQQKYPTLTYVVEWKGLKTHEPKT